MNCTDVVDRFSEYLDGTSPEADSTAIERHLETCEQCVRYRDVLVSGTELLRGLPEPELRADFEPRLRHRLYHVDDERVLRDHAASGASAVTVLGIAVLLTVVAWSPAVFMRAPVVQLAPIVVDRAPDRSPYRPASSPPGMFSTKTEPDLDDPLWQDQLIYDYSELRRRYDPRARVRRALLIDR